MPNRREGFILCSYHRKEVGIMRNLCGVDVLDVDELIFGEDERVICSER